MNHNTFRKVKNYIEKYHMIAPNDTVVAGVSGGADSVCLFLMLCTLAEEMDFRLAAVHVNHGIRPEAAEDASYVERLCRSKGIPFVLAERDVKGYAKREHLSEEEAGRKIRYQAFEEALQRYGKNAGGMEADMEGSCRKSGKIAVAHNANDRAETMLFHLFRGTGLTGAGGMKPVRDNVIRPLLCLERREIEEYLKEKGISFCIDRTNLEDTYTRNRIRNHILPFAENEICQGTVMHMCKAADLFLEADGYIRRQADKAYEGCVIQGDGEKIVLDIKKLGEEEPLIKKQVFLQCMEMLTEGRKDIASVHVEGLERLLEKEGSKWLSMPYGLRARKEYGHLVLYHEKIFHENNREQECGQAFSKEIAVGLPDAPEEMAGLDIPGLGIVEFTVFSREKALHIFDKFEIISGKTYTKWLDYDKITKSLMFRTRRAGDYLTINKKFSKKKLKNYMIEEKIPREARESLYVLADGSHIIWIPGYRISEYYKITEETKYILKVQLRGGL